MTIQDVIITLKKKQFKHVSIKLDQYLKDQAIDQIAIDPEIVAQLTQTVILVKNWVAGRLNQDIQDIGSLDSTISQVQQIAAYVYSLKFNVAQHARLVEENKQIQDHGFEFGYHTVLDSVSAILVYGYLSDPPKQNRMQSERIFREAFNEGRTGALKPRSVS